MPSSWMSSKFIVPVWQVIISFALIVCTCITLLTSAGNGCMYCWFAHNSNSVHCNRHRRQRVVNQNWFLTGKFCLSEFSPNFGVLLKRGQHNKFPKSLRSNRGFMMLQAICELNLLHNLQPYRAITLPIGNLMCDCSELCSLPNDVLGFGVHWVSSSYWGAPFLQSFACRIGHISRYQRLNKDPYISTQIELRVQSGMGCERLVIARLVVARSK